MKKDKLYLLLQFGGWTTYIVLLIIIKKASNVDISIDTSVRLALIFLIGLVTTHFYRYWIKKRNWSKLEITQIIYRITFASILLPLITQVTYYTTAITILKTSPFEVLDIALIINWSVLLFIWNVIYFAYQFFERYRFEEIKNLKWEATKNEIELNKLKSQLNPHFIFNSMNSIRALIDEDPAKAKRSVTQLANILRNTLMMGRKKTVLFEEELAIVNDFIELEKTRYEERLTFTSEIDESAYSYQVPSLMIQTLIENGIKHGISQLPEGGIIHIKAITESNFLILEIENTGKLITNSKPETGFGIINTTQRLNLLYGNLSSFEIFNTKNNTVITRVKLPKEPI